MNKDATIPTSANEGQSRRQRLLRLLAFTATILIVLPVMVPMLVGAMGMWGLTHPPCAESGAKPTLPHREITIPARIGPLRGFLISGSKDAVIIVPPAFNGGHSGMLHEANLLAQDGFNVITFESRVCAGKGAISLGYAEVDDVIDVISYLKQNGDGVKVNSGRIALHGFSSAGATSTMAAARSADVRALLAEGGYHNINELMNLNTAQAPMEKLMVLGAQLTYRLTTGYDTDVLSPLDAIKQIPPRPILLVYGSQEPSLPGALKQLAAARAVDPQTIAQLWIVPGATHGGYLSAVGPETYQSHVLPFYNCALLQQQCEKWDALWIKPAN